MDPKPQTLNPIYPGFGEKVRQKKTKTYIPLYPLLKGPTYWVHGPSGFEAPVIIAGRIHFHSWSVTVAAMFQRAYLDPPSTLK